MASVARLNRQKAKRVARVRANLRKGNRAGKVMAIVQSVREGRDNDPGFFSRMKPSGVWADLFRTRFRLACQRLELNREQPVLDCGQFVRPEVGGQLRLF